MKSTIKIFILLAGFFFLLACGGSSSLGKENRSIRDNLDGNWQLTEVTYAGEGYYKSTLFGDANAKCFQGSSWFFRSNNSTGTYTLDGADCNPGVRYIRWSVQNDANGNPSKFTFKFTDEKKKDLYGGAGYVFDIQTANETTLVLASREQVGDDTIDLVYAFNKQ